MNPDQTDAGDRRPSPVRHLVRAYVPDTGIQQDSREEDPFQNSRHAAFFPSIEVMTAPTIRAISSAVTVKTEIQSV